jgi:hypothetical protein
MILIISHVLCTLINQFFPLRKRAFVLYMYIGVNLYLPSHGKIKISLCVETIGLSGGKVRDKFTLTDVGRILVFFHLPTFSEEFVTNI